MAEKVKVVGESEAIMALVSFLDGEAQTEEVAAVYSFILCDDPVIVQGEEHVSRPYLNGRLQAE